jgi:hypothetical protein
MTRACAWGFTGGLGTRPGHGLGVEDVQVVQHLVFAFLVVVVSSEDVHVLPHRGGCVVGAGRRRSATLGGLGHVGPYSVVGVEGG